MKLKYIILGYIAISIILMAGIISQVSSSFKTIKYVKEFSFLENIITSDTIYKDSKILKIKTMNNINNISTQSSEKRLVKELNSNINWLAIILIYIFIGVILNIMHIKKIKNNKTIR